VTTSIPYATSTCCSDWVFGSDILKFEYLTQLLLDCNYVPLLLKLWAHQDVQQLVDRKTDRTEHRYAVMGRLRKRRRHD